MGKVMRINTHHLIFLSIVIFFLFSCSSSDRIDGYIYYRLNADPTTLDPALITDVSSASVAAKLFNGLVRLNDELEIVPDIAERWEISVDGLRYRFYLKKGVMFSNGREVRANDFKYSFERILNPETRSPNTWVFEKVIGSKEFRDGLSNEVKGFEVIDDYTFQIRLETAFAPFLSMLTMTPCYVIPEEEVLRKEELFSSEPVGSGPFVLKKWLHNREIILHANRDYFDKKAKAGGIVYKIIPEDMTALTEFELGNLDVISLPASAYSRFKNDKKWNKHIIALKGLNTYYLGMNTSRQPFDSIIIRRAVAYAIDREKILKTFYEGRGRLAEGPVPDILRKWSIRREILPGYNPEMARDMIVDQGYNRIKVNMYVTADRDVVDLAEIIQSYLSKVGIDVNISQLEWSAYKDAINKGEPDMFWLSWWADYPDPENFLFPLFHSSNIGSAGNRTRYINHEVDNLIERGQISSNKREAFEFYKRAEEIIIKEMPWVFFWHRTDFLVKQPWINGYKVYPIYTIDKGLNVTIQR